MGSWEGVVNNRWGYLHGLRPPTDSRRAYAQHPPNPARTWGNPKATAARWLREGHPHALLMGKIDRAIHICLFFSRNALRSVGRQT